MIGTDFSAPLAKVAVCQIISIFLSESWKHGWQWSKHQHEPDLKVERGSFLLTDFEMLEYGPCLVSHRYAPVSWHEPSLCCQLSVFTRADTLVIFYYCILNCVFTASRHTHPMPSQVISSSNMHGRTQSLLLLYRLRPSSITPPSS